MKLSEAILEGTKHSEPTKYYRYVVRERTICACVIGAAAIGYVVKELSLPPEEAQQYTYTELADIFPVLGRQIRTADDTVQPVIDRMIDLNDDDGWTRERIAAWVAATYESDDNGTQG